MTDQGFSLFFFFFFFNFQMTINLVWSQKMGSKTLYLRFRRLKSNIFLILWQMEKNVCFLKSIVQKPKYSIPRWRTSYILRISSAIREAKHQKLNTQILNHKFLSNMSNHRTMIIILRYIYLTHKHMQTMTRGELLRYKKRSLVERIKEQFCV